MKILPSVAILIAIAGPCAVDAAGQVAELNLDATDGFNAVGLLLDAGLDIESRVTRYDLLVPDDTNIETNDDIDIDPAPPQCDCERQPRNTAANNEDSHVRTMTTIAVQLGSAYHVAKAHS